MSTFDRTDVGFSRVEIEAQVDHIVTSEKLSSADQLGRFLRYVVTETLDGRQAQIKQYTIGVKALGRAADFDPQSDPVVRMYAHRLRRALNRYYDTDGADDPIRIKIPKGRYVPVFVPNLAVPHASSTTPVAAHIGNSDSRSQALLARPSIAVLPFVFLGSDEDDAYFATGLTEEVVIALTRFPEFLVVGPLNRETVWKQHLSARGIGREYGVRFVLDGTVRKRADTLRVTAKLTDAGNGAHLWARSLDYRVDIASILEIENEVVGQVASAIADNFGIIPRSLAGESLDLPADNLSDYEAILRFYHYTRTLTEDAYVGAFTALENAVGRNPDNATTAALYGDLIASAYHLGHGDTPSVVTRAEELGLKAIALDPTCQPAHFTMALVHVLRYEREPCMGEIDLTIGLNPNNANYVAACGLLLGMMAETDRGLDLMHKAMRLNPHHPGWYHIVAYMDQYRRREFDSALLEAKRFNTPGFFWDPLVRASVLAQLGRQEEASEAIEELLDLVPDFVGNGKDLMRRLVYSDANVEMLWEGLVKAGLDR